MLTLDNVYRAGYVLKEVVRKTDVIPAPKLAPGVDLYLKTENLQITGSFKVRGAYYKMSKLTAAEKARGVIACSAGNHAQGVALSAQKNGIKDGDYVDVLVESIKPTKFFDVQVRVRDDFNVEMHIDTDDANACGLKNGEKVKIIKK